MKKPAKTSNLTLVSIIEGFFLILFVVFIILFKDKLLTLLKKRGKFSSRHILWIMSFCLFALSLYIINNVSKVLYEMEDYKNEFYSTHSDQLTPKNLNLVNKVDSSGLAFDLIDTDLSNGIINNLTAEKAKANVLSYISDVQNDCHTDLSDLNNAKFVECAGRKISQHFYYRPGSDVAANYANHNSDCDASTYLMMTAANRVGIESSIVYAPGHAFFSWKDRFGNHHYWETTTNNNRGQFADFSQSLYRKSMSPAYYNPEDSTFAKKLYISLIYTQSNNKFSVEKSLESLRHNQFVSDILLYEKSQTVGLTDEDAAYLQDGLAEDFTSTDRKMALASYYLSLNNKNKAYAYLSTISHDECYQSCLHFLSKTKAYYYIIEPFYTLIESYFDKHDAKYSLDTFNFILSALFCLFVALFLAVLAHIEGRAYHKGNRLASHNDS